MKSVPQTEELCSCLCGMPILDEANDFSLERDVIGSSLGSHLKQIMWGDEFEGLYIMKGRDFNERESEI